MADDAYRPPNQHRPCHDFVGWLVVGRLHVIGRGHSQGLCWLGGGSESTVWWYLVSVGINGAVKHHRIIVNALPTPPVIRAFRAHGSNPQCFTKTSRFQSACFCREDMRTQAWRMCLLFFGGVVQAQNSVEDWIAEMCA